MDKSFMHGNGFTTLHWNSVISVSVVKYFSMTVYGTLVADDIFIILTLILLRFYCFNSGKLPTVQTNCCSAVATVSITINFAAL